jgi:hypothetical protein
LHSPEMKLTVTNFKLCRGSSTDTSRAIQKRTMSRERKVVHGKKTRTICSNSFHRDFQLLLYLLLNYLVHQAIQLFVSDTLIFLYSLSRDARDLVRDVPVKLLRRVLYSSHR